MIKWIRTSRLSIQNTLSASAGRAGRRGGGVLSFAATFKIDFRPLGPLGFDFAQHRRTPRPSVEKDPQKNPASFRNGSRGSSPPVQMARGERLKGGPFRSFLGPLGPF